jgi:hypothetical protein
MTQYELSAKSGVAQPRISLAERRLIKLNEAEKRAIAQIVGVVDWGDENDND